MRFAGLDAVVEARYRCLAYTLLSACGAPLLNSEETPSFREWRRAVSCSPRRMRRRERSVALRGREHVASNDKPILQWMLCTIVPLFEALTVPAERATTPWCECAPCRYLGYRCYPTTGPKPARAGAYVAHGLGVRTSSVALRPQPKPTHCSSLIESSVLSAILTSLRVRIMLGRRSARKGTWRERGSRVDFFWRFPKRFFLLQHGGTARPLP